MVPVVVFEENRPARHYCRLCEPFLVFASSIRCALSARRDPVLLPNQRLVPARSVRVGASRVASTVDMIAIMSTNSVTAKPIAAMLVGPLLAFGGRVHSNK